MQSGAPEKVPDFFLPVNLFQTYIFSCKIVILCLTSLMFYYTDLSNNHEKNSYQLGVDYVFL